MEILCGVLYTRCTMATMSSLLQWWCSEDDVCLIWSLMRNIVLYNHLYLCGVCVGMNLIMDTKKTYMVKNCQQIKMQSCFNWSPDLYGHLTTSRMVEMVGNNSKPKSPKEAWEYATTTRECFVMLTQTLPKCWWSLLVWHCVRGFFKQNLIKSHLLASLKLENFMHTCRFHWWGSFHILVEKEETNDTILLNDFTKWYT